MNKEVKMGIELILLFVLPVLFYTFLNFLLGWILFGVLLVTIGTAIVLFWRGVVEEKVVAVFVLGGLAIAPGLCFTLNLDQYTSSLVIVATIVAGVETMLFTDFAYDDEEADEQ